MKKCYNILRIGFTMLILLSANFTLAQNKTPATDLLKQYLIKTKFIELGHKVVNVRNIEAGLTFSANEPMKITELQVRVPGIYEMLRVTIWDYDTQKVLRKEYMKVPQMSKKMIMKIKPFELKKNKKYVISMNFNDWYSRFNRASKNATYPIKLDEITIHDFRFTESGETEQIFPGKSVFNVYHGDLNFVVEKYH